MKSPVRVWDITAGFQTVTVFARTFGHAARKAARAAKVTLCTDHDSGGFKNAFGAVRANGRELSR